MSTTPDEPPTAAAGEPDPEVGGEGGADVEQLRAERDALKEQVGKLEHRVDRRLTARRFGAGFLVVLTCIALVGAVAGVWARRNFLDTDRFVSRAAPLIEEPAVQAAVSNRITDEVMVLLDPQKLLADNLPDRAQLLAPLLVNAVRGFVSDQVTKFVASPTFQSLWDASLANAHHTAVRLLRGEASSVSVGDQTVTLNLVPIIDAVLANLSTDSPQIFGRTIDVPKLSVNDVPQTAIDKINETFGTNLDKNFGQITVYDNGTLNAAQAGLDIFDKSVIFAVILAPIFAALALWLSPRRRRTIMQLCIGATIGMVLLRRVSFRLQSEVSGLPPTPEGQESAKLTLEAFLDPLRTFAAWAIAGLLLIAFVTWVTSDHAWARSLRHRVATLGHLVTSTAASARDEVTAAWVAQHRDPLLAGGVAVGVVALFVLDLSWFWLLVLLALIAGYALAVMRVADEGGYSAGEPVDVRDQPAPPSAAVAHDQLTGPGAAKP